MKKMHNMRPVLIVTVDHSYCEENDLDWTWAYLWAEWYCKEKWSLWARSVKNEISTLKTTMIVESHWRTIKHDYLYKFNRPRVDLLTWVLVARFIPRCIVRHQQLVQSRSSAPWRKKFKKSWKKCSRTEVSSSTEYTTNPIDWTCSCKAYLEGRFLICKHLIQSVRPVGPDFFRMVERRRSPPFLAHPDLLPMVEEPDFGDQIQSENEVNSVSESDIETDDEEIDEGIQDAEVESETYSIVTGPGDSFEEVNGRIHTLLQRWTDILKGEEEYKDARFWLQAEAAMRGIERMAAKCEKVLRKRKILRTWRDRDEQTMYYRGPSNS